MTFSSAVLLKSTWLEERLCSKSDKKIIEAVIGHNYQKGLAEYNTNNARALETLVNKHKVQLKTFSKEIMEKLIHTADDVVKDVAKTDQLSRDIYNSYMDMRRTALQWNSIADAPYLSARTLKADFGAKL